jgi:hypothetical protein
MIAPREPRWVVLTWRLPSGSSTPRVNLWRSLRRLGAAVLTPGAAILPFREDLQEQLDWLAQEIEAHEGDAWVLPVLELSEPEERRVRDQLQTSRRAEYDELREDARAFLQRAPEHPDADGDYALRLRTEKELLALQRRFRKIRARDYFDAPGRREASRTIDRCLAFRQGISTKLSPVTDERLDSGG